MTLMRSSLLWASRNKSMERLVRSSRLIRPLVSQFMPGENLDAAIDAVRRLHADRVPVVMTYLGENVSTDAAADDTLAEYERLFNALKSVGADAHVSIKLTQFGWDVDRNRALERVRRLIKLAETNGTQLPIDMESSEYVDSTVAAYEQLARESKHVAVCLQAYLHRTPADLDRLLAVRPSIRLVKGAYRESASVVLQRREDIDARYRALATKLLSATKTGTRVAFGTHDVPLISAIRDDARKAGVADNAYEIQMLYGIQEGALKQLVQQGMRTRVLISYGRAWYPWFMRRLAEKPANLMLIPRNLFS